MKKQILALGLILTLSVAVTNCSRNEEEQITNKTDNSLKKDDAPTIRTSNYELSNDKQTLIRWFNKETLTLDMQNDPELQNVTRISSDAFLDGFLYQIVLPNHLKEIGGGAFAKNRLISINIPNSVTSIGGSAFYNNYLTSVNIPSSVTSIGGGAFCNNKLTSVTISKGVTSIGNEAFYNNQLTSVTIPNSVTSIGERAFSFNQLTSVTIPNSVTSIGDYAFRNSIYNHRTTKTNQKYPSVNL